MVDDKRGRGINHLAKLCSQNQGKLRELRVALPDWELDLLDIDDFPTEDGNSYYENARAKAVIGRLKGDPGAWMLGEDSGIEVDGLDGRPGIESARFGGIDPVGTLLEALQGVDNRRARYIAELVALSPAGEEHHGTGVLEGRIVDDARGSEGFGYDPIFVPDGEERTVAELGNDWKRSHSHRVRAAQALLAALRASSIT
jgi:Xanthosine triphosphate pyrophosphatase